MDNSSPPTSPSSSHGYPSQPSCLYLPISCSSKLAAPSQPTAPIQNPLEFRPPEPWKFSSSPSILKNRIPPTPGSPVVDGPESNSPDTPDQDLEREEQR